MKDDVFYAFLSDQFRRTKLVKFPTEANLTDESSHKSYYM